MKTIALTKGKVALVDDADFDALNQYRWYFSTGSMGYAARGTSEHGKKKTVYMHRQITKAGSGETVDHQNHNTLDNRRCNLRKCSFAENHRNMQKSRGRSRFKGVYKARKGWQARLSHNCKLLHLGYFSNEKEAALAYNNAAQLYYGQYAHLNAI